jgi:pyruvate carboxylase
MEQQKTDRCEAALQLALKVGYQNAGVAKFLMDIKGEAALTEHPGS